MSDTQPAAGVSPAVMVCLISRQTMQNLLPILQYRPKKVVFVSTKEEDESRRVLETVLRSQMIPFERPIYVDAYAPESTAEACAAIAARHPAAEVVANVTGGTKVMSLAAFRVFAAAGASCVYTDTPHRRILHLHPEDRGHDRLDTKIGVLAYLQAHGQLARLRDRRSRRSHPALAEFVGKNIEALDPFLARVRFEVRDAPEGATRFRFSVEGKQRNSAAAEFLQHAERAGLLTARPVAGELEIVFADPLARLWVEGAWLEDLVSEAVKLAGFDSSANNVALGWKDDPNREMNEIDVAVVHNLQFYYLSCKTGSDWGQLKDHLFELDTLAQHAGGLFNHPVLVASSPKALNAVVRRRAESLGISYVGPWDLPRLTARLKEIVR